MAHNNFRVLQCDSNCYGTNRPYQFTIRALSKQAVTFNNASLQLSWDQQHVHGVLSAMTDHGKKGQYDYTLTLSSPLFPLTLAQHNRTFVRQPLFHILQSIFTPHRVAYQLLTRTQNSIPFTVQYNQTDYDFLNILLMQQKLWLSFKHTEKSSTCIIQPEWPAPQFTFTLPFSSNLGIAHDTPIAFDCQVTLPENTLQAKTNHLALSPNQHIIIQQHPCAELNGNYRIIQLSHHFDQTAQAMRYHNQCLLQPSQQSPQLKQRPIKPRHIVLQARIDSPGGQYPQLDEHGRYRVRFYFDHANSSPPIAKVRAYHSHFPLPAGTEVAIGFIDGKWEQPVILGALTNPNTPDTTTARNATQNTWHTQGGNKIIWDDIKRNPSITLHTHKMQQKIAFHTHTHSPHIQLLSQKGKIQLRSQKNLIWQSGGSYHSHAQTTYATRIQKHQKLRTEKGNIQLRSGKNTLLQSTQDLRLQANELSMQTQKTLRIQSRAPVHVHGASYHINAHSITYQTKQCTIQSHQTIQLNNNTISENTICFNKASLNASTIVIYPCN